MARFIVEEVVQRVTEKIRVYEVEAPDELSALGALEHDANKTNNQIGETEEIEHAYEKGTPIVVYKFGQ
jgi:hypothetical protein